MEFCLFDFFHSNPYFAHNFQVDLALLLQYRDFFTRIMMILNPGQIQWLGDGACGGEGVLLEVDNWGSSSWPDAGPAYRYLVVNRKKRLQVPEEKIRNRLFYLLLGGGGSHLKLFWRKFISFGWNWWTYRTYWTLWK